MYGVESRDPLIVIYGPQATAMLTSNSTLDLSAEPGLTDFILNSASEIALTYGEDSWSLAIWNVTVGGFIDATNEARQGNYDKATVAIILAVVKPLKAAKSAGRAKNKLTPDPRAEGPHSTYRTGPDGKTSNYATYEANPRNPSGYQEVKRVDVTGRSHRNPDGTIVPTPHVREAGTRGVRPARPDELP